MKDYRNDCNMRLARCAKTTLNGVKNEGAETRYHRTIEAFVASDVDQKRANAYNQIGQ